MSNGIPVIDLLNRAMVRLLTANDWFGDHQMREVILDEFGELRRSLGSNYAVLDKPFRVMLVRLNREEDAPFVKVVNYEYNYLIEALKCGLNH